MTQQESKEEENNAGHTSEQKEKNFTEHPCEFERREEEQTRNFTERPCEFEG